MFYFLAKHFAICNRFKSTKKEAFCLFFYLGDFPNMEKNYIACSNFSPIRVCKKILGSFLLKIKGA
jgi:hypothetical protein